MHLLITLCRCAAFIAVFLASSASANCDSGEVVIRFSFVTNLDRHPKGIAATKLADRVNTEMDGRACMELFGNSILYTDDKVMSALLNGDIQMAAPSLPKVEEYTTLLRVFSLPFMFKNMDALNDFQDSLTGGLMTNSMIGKGFRGLGFWHDGMAQMSADRALVNPFDAKGLRMRTTGSAVGTAQMQALGAIPRDMAFSEVYGQLVEGFIDGQEDTFSNIYGKRFYKAQDSITQTDHAVIDSLLITSAAWFNTLTDDVKSDLLRITREVTQEQNEIAVEINAKARQLILDDGGQIRELTDAERAEWRAALTPIWADFIADVHPRLIAYIEAVNARN